MARSTDKDLKATADLVLLAARENAYVSVQENHGGRAERGDAHPDFHGYYVATADHIVEMLACETDYEHGEATQTQRSYGLSKALTAKQAAFVRKELGI